MSEMTLEQEIMAEVQKLDMEKRRKALDYVRSLARPRGISGKLAVQYAREIGFPKEDLEEMQQAINKLGEQIDDFPQVRFDE